MRESQSVAMRLREKLQRHFNPVELIVIDESAQHAGHAGARQGGESHFRVRIVSVDFAGASRVERQRRVYSVVKDEISAGLHALALTTLTPDEANR